MSTPLSATDILIVGAGPAGATASLFLAKAQIPHTLVDRATFPRDKADGNVYGAKVIEILDRLNPDYFPELAAQADWFLGGDEAQVFTPNSKSFKVKFPPSPAKDLPQDIPFFTMNRRHFDNFLVSKLDENYVDRRLGCTLTTLERQQDRWHITLEIAGQIATLNPKLIIAADGANSTVVQKLGLELPGDRYYDSVQGYFRGVTGFESPDPLSHIEGYFLTEVNPGFFFITPLADGIFSVGLCKPRPDVQQQHVDLQQLLQEIMHNHPQLSTRFTHCEPISDLRPWPITVGTLWRNSVSGLGYLIAGDAAGLCNPLAYFGTGNAMISGLLAAQQAQQALTQQRFDGPTLRAYDRALYERLQKEFQIGNILKSFVKRDWLFNWVTKSHQVRGALRQNFKDASAMLKKM